MPLLRRWAQAFFPGRSRRARPTCVPQLLPLESRDVPSGPDSPIPAFDVIQLTAMRQDAELAVLDGRLPGQARNVGIAIVDTGLYGAHSAIRGNFKAFVNVNSGFFTTEADEATAAQDPTGHGTHVASTAASTNPNIGVATGADLIGLGIADGDVLGNADSALSWVLANAQAFNIKVVNLSVRTGGDNLVNLNQLGAAPDPTGLASRIQELESQGITVVAASGNSYAAFAAPGVEVPAAYASLSVAATWEDAGTGDRFPFPAGSKGDLLAFDLSASPDRFASFSQRSSLPNQVAAPGATILGASIRGPDAYVDSAGTSMAAPMVSGLVALMQDAAITFGGRYLPVSDIVRIIRESSDLIVDNSHDQNGYYNSASGQLFALDETGLTVPRINVLKAVQQVRREVTAANVLGDLNAIISKAIALPALTTTLSRVTTGQISTDGTLTVGPDDVDLYQISLAAPGQLAVSATLPSSASGLRLRLLTPSGVDLPLTATSNGSTLAISQQLLPAGTYYVGVSSGANTQYNIITGDHRSGGIAVGDYSLSLALLSLDPDGTISTARDYRTGTTLFADPSTKITGTLRPGILGYNLLDDGAWQSVGSADVNMYRWVAADSGFVTIRVNSAQSLRNARPDNAVSFDTFLRVFLPDGSQYTDPYGTAGINGDSKGSTDSLLRLWVERGQSYIIAVSATGTSTGSSTPNRYDPSTAVGRTNPLSAFRGYYELSLELDTGDRDGSPLTANSMTLGGTVEGAIGRDDQGKLIGLDGRRDVNFYRFTAEQAGLLDLQLTGFSGYQTRASLWEATAAGLPGQLIQSGTGANLRWLVPVSEGRSYLLSVTGAANLGTHWMMPGYGSGGALGAYTLTTQLRPESDQPQFSTSSIQTALPISVNQFVQGDLSSDRFAQALTQQLVSVVTARRIWMFTDSSLPRRGRSHLASVRFPRSGSSVIRCSWSSMRRGERLVRRRSGRRVLAGP